jgi:hypothetical protein
VVLRIGLNQFIEEGEYVSVDGTHIQDLDGENLYFCAPFGGIPSKFHIGYSLSLSAVSLVESNDLTADRGMLTMPLYWGTPAQGAYTSHRTMLLLLEYAEQKLTPVFATPVVNADVCQGFNVQMSYKPGNPAKVCDVSCVLCCEN